MISRRHKIFIGFLSVLIVGMTALFLLRAADKTNTARLPVEEVMIETQSGKKHIFFVEIAERGVDTEIGLMHRQSLPLDQGMMFLLGREPVATAFWMKNTLIPLDMLFVGAAGIIMHIHANAEPQSLEPISSGYPVTAVIEINGGLAVEKGIRAGDRVLHPYFEPRSEGQ